MNEIEITQKAKHGNKYTFGLLVRKYKRQAYFSALAIIASYHDALDDLQQTFIRAYRACDRFNVDKRFLLGSPRLCATFVSTESGTMRNAPNRFQFSK